MRRPLTFFVAAITVLFSALKRGHSRHQTRVKELALLPMTIGLAASVLAGGFAGAESRATEQPPAALAAPTNLVAIPGNRRVTLTWNAVTGATSYRVFRSTTGSFGNSPLTTVSTTTYSNTNLTNGVTYYYRVVARNGGNDSPPSVTVNAKPQAAPSTPTGVAAVGGDQQVAVSWSAVSTATSYKVFRSLVWGVYSATPTGTVAAPATTFVDTGLTNGPRYYYAVRASNTSGDSSRSAQVSAFTEAPATIVDAETAAAFRLLRLTTWGPKPGDVARVKAIGHDAFIDEQLAMPPSQYVDPAPMTSVVEETQQQFLRLALTGPDQLRQRVAWALHKIWVVSTNDAEAAVGILAYQRLLMQHAFGNYRDLMKAMTLNPAMGHYLTMLNSRSEAATGSPANENYARELMQLFTIGLVKLNADGTPQLDVDGQPIPSYTQADVRALARILSGWTFGDGNPQTVPEAPVPDNYVAEMEPIDADHDTTAKTFRGQTFPAGVPAREELDRVLDLLFNDPNVGPFLARQLIRQLITSNPSPAYVRDVAAVFDDNGNGVRGDLRAVVRAILRHPEASAAGAEVGKLSEPILFVTTFLRALNATVPDLKIILAMSAVMGQQVFAPPSVFSYFPSDHRVRSTADAGGAMLDGPEFEILTDLTALERVNFIAQVLNGNFTEPVVIDWTPFTSRAADAAVLVDYCKELILGGGMTTAERAEIVGAVRATASNFLHERSQTALYLIFALGQFQVNR